MVALTGRSRWMRGGGSLHGALSGRGQFSECGVFYSEWGEGFVASHRGAARTDISGRQFFGVDRPLFWHCAQNSPFSGYLSTRPLEQNCRIQACLAGAALLGSGSKAGGWRAQIGREREKFVEYSVSCH